MANGNLSPHQTEEGKPSEAGFHFAQHLLHWAADHAERLYPASFARPIHTVGIVGAGMTGSRITLLVRRAGWNWVVVDPQAEALERLGSLLAETPPSAPAADSASNVFLASQVPLPCSASVDAQEPWVNFSQELSPLAKCDLVLECVPEKVRIKQELFHEAESYLSEGAVLATNTSTIPLARLAEGVRVPARFCGIHFFMPIPLRPVVEVVRGSQSSGQTISTAVAFIRRLGLTPLVVEDGPGFLGNRLLFVWFNEALQLLEEGYMPEEIDGQAVEFGWAMGPFALMDWIGLDVVLAGAWELAGMFEERLVRSSVLVTLVKKGYLGRKTGLGFYRYDFQSTEAPLEPSPRIWPNPEVVGLLAKTSRNGGVGQARGCPSMPPIKPVGGMDSAGGLSPADRGLASVPGKSDPENQPRSSRGVPSDGILKSPTIGSSYGESSYMDRLHIAMLVEAVQLIEEGRVKDPREVDLVLVWGLGFPASRGGLLAWADHRGLLSLLQGGEYWKTSTFLHHFAYQRLWERAHIQTMFYPNRPERLGG